jgi:hypothetical protein
VVPSYFFEGDLKEKLKNLSCYSRYSDWLRAGHWRGRRSSPGGVKNCLHVVQTGSGTHPASFPMGTGGSFPGVKRAGS